VTHQDAICILMLAVIGACAIFAEWRRLREQRRRKKWWDRYEAESIKRHDEFMAAMNRSHDETSDDESA